VPRLGPNDPNTKRIDDAVATWRQGDVALDAGGLPEGTYAYVLAVDDEDALMCVAVRLMRARVKFVPVFEPDLKGALTAIGVTPGRKMPGKKQ